MASPEFVRGFQDEGLADVPRKGSISEELDHLEKTITAQSEILDRLIGQLHPVLRAHHESKKENTIVEAEDPVSTALGNQISKQTAHVKQNNARIMLILELLEL